MKKEPETEMSEEERAALEAIEQGLDPEDTPGFVQEWSRIGPGKIRFSDEKRSRCLSFQVSYSTQRWSRMVESL